MESTPENMLPDAPVYVEMYIIGFDLREWMWDSYRAAIKIWNKGEGEKKFYWWESWGSASWKLKMQKKKKTKKLISELLGKCVRFQIEDCKDIFLQKVYHKTGNFFCLVGQKCIEN